MCTGCDNLSFPRSLYTLGCWSLSESHRKIPPLVLLVTPLDATGPSISPFLIAHSIYSQYPTFWQFILFIIIYYALLLLAIWCMCMNVYHVWMCGCVYICKRERELRIINCLRTEAMIPTSSFFASSSVSAKLKLNLSSSILIHFY